MKLAPSFKRRCEAIAVDQRYRLGLRPFDPLSAEKLLIAIGGEAKSPDQIPNMPPNSVANLLNAIDWSAGIIRRNPLLIVYHPAYPPARHQSNLMHEIAHILLNHPMIGFDSITGLPLRDLHCEDEAVYLGGCLQIPRLALQWALQKSYNVARIATYFNASESMVVFRCNMMNMKLAE